jgi:hypothetical protein
MVEHQAGDLPRLSSRCACGSGRVRRHVGGDATIAGSCGMQPGLLVGGAVHLDLGVAVALEALDDDEVDRESWRSSSDRVGSGAPRSSVISAQRLAEATSTCRAPAARCS